MASIAAWVLVSMAAGAEPVRLSGTELREDGAHRALFEAGGRVRSVAAGDAAGPCTVRLVAARHVLLDCPEGPRRLVLSESLEPRAVPGGPSADDDPPAVLDVSLPAAPFRRAIADRQGIALDVTVEPAVRDGRLFGYRIAGLRPEGRFAGIGLEEGDVLLALNGAPVADPSGLMQVLRGLSTAPGFECLIQRDGETRIHRYQLVD